MLAGRKLLLADDSVTIQKVIELTFADEGVRVIAFGNGDEAIDHLDEVAPDIVLADVFMPGKSGFEVCQYIKHSEKHKHIPVMLLVGSFEPFDEAEARRVGADDILTKPFQSIRRLIDRVGSLVGSRPADQREVPTAELPHANEPSAPVQKLDTEELAMTTADTQPLPEELRAEVENRTPAFAAATVGESRMETANRYETQTEADSLLDLGDYEPVTAAVADDFVLDLDVEDEPHNGSEDITRLYDTPAPQRTFVEPELTQTSSPEPLAAVEYQPEVYSASPAEYQASVTYDEPEVAYEDQVHEVPPVPEYVPAPVPVSVVAEAPSESTSSAAPISADSLSPEMIDAIARRVVEMMSDSVVREIAWEVVPELAELLIKRQLEQKESQHQ
ncbi:MAG TPA: response regulator [Pyrinomonadaceae bacterium]|nr:response regulator [Pyrinomonadaceae bacterium]